MPEQLCGFIPVVLCDSTIGVNDSPRQPGYVKNDEVARRRVKRTVAQIELALQTSMFRAHPTTKSIRASFVRCAIEGRC